MLLQEARSEAAGLQGQPRQHGAAGEQGGQRLRHAVAQRVHADVKLLKALWGGSHTQTKRKL